jgi:exosortase E/protease (VPEID-CTERM system)
MAIPLSTQALKRVGILGAVTLAELLTISVWLDGASLSGRHGLVGEIGIWGAWILRFLVGFAAAFAAFAGIRGNIHALRLLDSAAPVRWPMLALHIACAGIFAPLSAAIYGNWSLPFPELAAFAWITAGLFAFVTLGLTFYPAAVWAEILRSTKTAWFSAAGVSALGVAVFGLSQSMWQSAAKLTFELVQLLLRPILPNLIVQPERMRLQGHTFGVIISQECSGLEGVGLILVFCTVWLWLFRNDFRFPRALLLVPAGAVILYLLNAVRIAALLLIGDAGAEQIAAGGFHSQAGWIAFNGVAFGMTLVVPRLRWFALHPIQPASASAAHAIHDENPTAPYLIPFLAILATGMLTRAVSADFEWLYGIRFLTAAISLWIFRKPLLALDWRFSWWGPLTGIAVLLIWLGLDRWQAIPTTNMPGALTAASATARWAWIAFRILAATITVPIAEELAFRGFLMRRIVSTDFEAVALRSTTWLGVLLSSLLFGWLHGERWIAGILAGLAFALVSRHTNRLGDAVIAHACTNAILASLVPVLDQWQYW